LTIKWQNVGSRLPKKNLYYFVVYMKRNFVIVDLETTGLSPYKHAITEIAAVRFDGEHMI
jgi:DNA polymerase III epsilon subunit-like protein